jgi:hypothetical protein
VVGAAKVSTGTRSSARDRVAGVSAITATAGTRPSRRSTVTGSGVSSTSLILRGGTEFGDRTAPFAASRATDLGVRTASFPALWITSAERTAYLSKRCPRQSDGHDERHGPARMEERAPRKPGVSARWGIVNARVRGTCHSGSRFVAVPTRVSMVHGCHVNRALPGKRPGLAFRVVAL